MTSIQKYFDLTDRVALVTGASSGIGAATAITLADLGARVAVGYHLNVEGASEVERRINAHGEGRAVAMQADVRDVGAIQALVARVTGEVGPIDILVNNAG